MAYSKIVWWQKNDSEVIHFAVKELQTYLGRITNVPMTERKFVHSEIINTSIAELEGMIVLEKKPIDQLVSRLDQRFNDSISRLEGMKEDSFMIEVSESYILLAGQNQRGILYAVYTFLEKLGVRFFAPQFEFYQSHAEHVPRLETIELKEMLDFEESSFDYRRKYIEEGYSHTPTNVIQLIDWMAKKKLNTLVFPMDYQGLGVVRWDDWRDILIPELQKRGMLIEVGGHGYGSFLSPDKYKDQHPEWFQDPDESVEGIQKANPNVFRFNNADALEAYIQEVIDYLKERPEISIFDAWPPDHATWSQKDVAPHGNIANSTAFIANRLTERMKQELPHVKIEGISYIPAAEPPADRYMYDSSVIMDFAPYDRSYTELIYDQNSEINTFYNHLFQQWKDQGFHGAMCIYEYYTKYSWSSLPVHLIKLMIEEMPHYHQLEIKGFGTYSEPGNWLTYELTHLLVADFSWNVEQSGESFLEDYFNYRFGAAAAKVRAYFEWTEKAGRTIFNSPKGDFSDEQKMKAVLEYYDEAKKHLLEALKRNNVEKAVEFMLQRLAWNLDFAIALTEMKLYEWQRHDAAASKQKWTEHLIHKHCFDGIILKNDYLLRIYNEAIPMGGHAGKVDTKWVRNMYKDRWR